MQLSEFSMGSSPRQLPALWKLATATLYFQLCLVFHPGLRPDCLQQVRSDGHRAHAGCLLSLGDHHLSLPHL